VPYNNGHVDEEKEVAAERINLVKRRSILLICMDMSIHIVNASIMS
jgi:hypothetical protein